MSIQIIGMAIGIIASSLVAAVPIPVLELDLNRYQGTWFEVARIPNRFQKACSSHAVARYSLLDTGELVVENQCETATGKRKKAQGLARRPNSNEPGKLEVSLFRILGLRPVWGSYWVLAIDAEYEVAVVGDSKQKYAWVLARTPMISKSSMQVAMAVLTRNGYSIEGMIKTRPKPAL